MWKRKEGNFGHKQRKMHEKYAKFEVFAQIANSLGCNSKANNFITGCAIFTTSKSFQNFLHAEHPA